MQDPLRVDIDFNAQAAFLKKGAMPGQVCKELVRLVPYP